MMPSSISKFVGESGRSRLIEVLSRNPGVGFDAQIAKFIAENGELQSFVEGHEIITQGDGEDRDVYFLLQGEVSVVINGTVKRSRKAPFQVGELAALDAAAKRSASVVVKSETVELVRLNVEDFERLIDEFPGFVARIEEDKTARFMQYVDEVETHRKVVILVHGIRTRAPWYKDVKEVLERNGYVVELTSYGRFDLFRFLEWSTFFRRQLVRRMSKTFRQICYTNSGADISVIAHSFGSYVALSVFDELFEISLRRIILVGSVVPEQFDVLKIQDRHEGKILNEVANKDVWPVVAESISFGYGSTGTYGFRNPGFIDRWHDAGHSTLLSAKHCEEFWLPYLESGEVVSGDGASQVSKFSDFFAVFKLRYVLIFAVFISIWLI